MDPVAIANLALGILSLAAGTAALALWTTGTPRRLQSAMNDVLEEQSAIKRKFGELAAECGALDTAVERRLEEMEGLRASIESKRKRVQAVQDRARDDQGEEPDFDANGLPSSKLLARARALGIHT